MYNFSDVSTQEKMLEVLILGINKATAAEQIKAGTPPESIVNLYDFQEKRRMLINRVGIHRGLRSKYDGSGNLRTPMKVSRFMQ